MKLDRTPNRLTLSSLILAAALAGACGDDAKPSDTDDDKSPSQRDDGGSPSGRDGGAPGRDGGSSGGSDASSSGGNRDASSGRDSGGGTTDPTASTAGNTIYTGMPSCEGKTGRKIAGTLDGQAISYDLSDIAETTDNSFSASGGGDDRGLIELAWEPDFGDDGKPSTINEGELELPSTYDSKVYCVLEGKAQHGKDDEEGRIRDFYLLTKLQEQVNGKCTGPELEAELKICSSYL